jgi:hypothetical protein
MWRYFLPLAFAGLLALGAAPAQERACLHGPSETPAQAARRRAAVEFARLINTTETTAHGQAMTYYALSDLHTIPAPPEGFKAQLSSDGTSYTFSIKDTLDPCRFAFFSDQEGVIYTATPLR